GDAEPAALARNGDLAIVLEIVIVDLFELAVEDADQAFMKNEEARRLRRALARDQPVRVERDGRIAIVGDALRDGEQEVLVDRNLAREDEALAVVPGQR